MVDGRDDGHKGRTSTKYAAKKAATERIALARAAEQKAARRRNVMVAGGSTLAVVVVIGLIVGIGLATKKSTGSGNPVNAASSTVTAGLASAAALTSQTPDLTLVKGPPARLTGAPLTSGGKPEILYVGAEYCPYCAVTRWPLTVALSRFGTFSNLKTTLSSATDAAGPNTPTLSYYGATYSSPYFDLVTREQEDGVGKPLETLSGAEASLFANYGKNSYPFVDFGGTWMQHVASGDPLVLAGLTPDQVAKDIADPTTKPGAMTMAGSDTFTAIICGVDGGKPANVCTSIGVVAATAALSAIK
jgi:Domain of unknown function (DUF929)